MADPLTASILLGAGALAVAGAGTGYQISSAMDAADQADAAAQEQKNQADTALKQQQERDRRDQDQRTSQAMLARTRRLRSSSGYGGRNGTILTSGIIGNSFGGDSIGVGQAPTQAAGLAGKTLLGA